MRKKSCVKLLTALLAAAMILSAVGCGGGSKPAESTAASTAAVQETQAVSQDVSEGTETPAEEAAGGVTFPLAEPVTFDIMVMSDNDVQDMASRVPLLQEMEEKTNVKINWIVLPTETAMNNLNSLFTSGQEGDAILGMKTTIGEANTASMGSSGLFIPLEEYIDNPDLMPNINKRIFAESPKTRAAIACPDGHVYALPGYNALMGNWLETPMWINTEWLEAVDEDMPASLEDLHRVLTKFKENDVNGNGDPNDEIPLMIAQNGSSNYVEALLQLWGLATKDLTGDRYIDIKDGKCYYVGTDETYREAIRTIASWYEEGLIWSEVYTANRDTWNAVITKEEAPVCGVSFAKDYPANVIYEEQYAVIPPFSADGYEAKWWLHPGVLGDKGTAYITRSCEHPEILAAWFDQFYDFETSLEAEYGVEGGLWSYNDAGKVVVRNANWQDETDLAYIATGIENNLFYNMYECFTQEDYDNRIELSGLNKVHQASYEIYKDVIGTEIWPRPYMTDDITSRINELYTDIDTTADMYRANWITGVTDIDEEWDSYLETMNKIGIEEFVDLHQQAYDTYLSNMGQ